MPDRFGGTEIYTLNLAKAQKSKKHTVFIVCPDYWGRSDTIYDGIDVKYYYEARRVAKKQELIGAAAPEGLFNFINLIKLLGADIVHFHEISGSNGISAFHIESLKRENIINLVTFHVVNNSCKTGTLLYKNKYICDGKIIENKCVKCAINKRISFKYLTNLVSSLSILIYKLKLPFPRLISYPKSIFYLKFNLNKIFNNTDKIILLANWYKKVLIINGIPENKIEIVKSACGLPISNEFERAKKVVFKKMIFLGRITFDKGLHVLINAIKLLKDSDILIDVYGPIEDSEYFNNCLNAINKNQLNIKFNESVEPYNILNLLKGYDALVLPSFSEMSSLVIQEAFTAGIPVIASNISGNAEQITDRKNGLLFDVGNEYSLKNTILYFYNSSNLKSSLIDGISKKSRNFSIVSDELESIYLKIINSTTVKSNQ
jgi:glycosyltransferase involved in cell wall biosynthesis